MKKTDPVIYIVEDNQNVSQALQWLLEATIALPVITYQHAGEFLKSLSITLMGLYTDRYLMPGIGGFGLLSELKKLNNKMPVIMLTAHGDASMASKAITMGASDFIINLLKRMNYCKNKTGFIYLKRMNNVQ